MTRAPGSFVLIALATLVFLAACSGDNPVQEPEKRAQAQSESNSRQRPETQSGRHLPAESQGQQSLRQAEADSPGSALADRDPLDQALTALSEWTRNLDTAVLEAQAGIEHAGAEAVVNTRITLRRSPTAVLSSIELSAMSSFIQLLEGDEQYADEPGLGFVLHELSTAEGVFAALSGRLLAPLSQSATDVSVFKGQPLFPGWIESRSAGEPPGEGDVLLAIQALAGISPPVATDANDLGEFAQFERVVSCILEFDGTVVEERMEGEPVWILECPIGANTSFGEAVAVVTGLDIPDSGDGPQLLSLRLRLVIDRDTGAPVRHEVVWHYRVPDEQDDYILTGTLMLKHWNQPVELPDPEPLVDPWWLNSVHSWAQLAAERRGGACSIGGTELEGPYGFVASWASAVDELRASYSATLVIDGKRSVVATSVQSSHSQVAYESQSYFQDGSLSRRLWTEGGFWVSNEEQDGNPVWVTSAPGLHGLGTSLEQFLSGGSRVNLDHFNPRGRLDCTVREAPVRFGPNAVTLRLSGGRETANERTSERLHESLRGLLTDLIGVDMRIDEMLEYTTTIHYRRYTGEPMELLTEAVFVTDGRPASLTITATFDADAGIKFSDPSDSR